MKKITEQVVKYDRPNVGLLEMETMAVLCASSEELDDLRKEDFDFGWEN